MINLVLCILFCWTVPKTGTDTEYYLIHVANEYGQIVETAVTADSLYCVQYEGEFRVSAAGVDSLGRVGEFSEWSYPTLSKKESEKIFYMARRLNVMILKYITAYSQYIFSVWEDPHKE